MISDFSRGSGKMFEKKRTEIDGESVIEVTGLGYYDLYDTFECGQAFRYELLRKEPDYVEYMTVVGDKIIRVGQKRRGQLIFFELSDEEFERIAVPYFALDTDYEEIRRDILERCDSAWLASAAESAKGVVILKQDPWEALFSFIVSQNNNIPRIRKIIRKICSEYGENLAERKGKCPLDSSPVSEKCKECGKCYKFPTPEEIVCEPEKLLSSNPGFRYRYLCDAAERVSDKRTNLEMIGAARSYTHTVECLKEIVGVGDKVASCVALFGFANLEAFPIDVWMKRAIDTYFEGKLDPATLGRYAGVAQQYIFHYIRNLESKTT